MNSAFVTYTWVVYKAPDGQRLRGQVVGPDQKYSPSPVFVSFPSTVFVWLVPVTELELADEP